MEKVFEIHPEKCTGCGGCELACSLLNNGEFKPSVSRARVVREENGDNFPKVCPKPCQDDPWCAKYCPTNALEVK